MNKHQLLGIHLLAACLLSFIWALQCPKFTTRGQVQTVTPVRHIEDGTPQMKVYYQLDAGRYAAGEVVIWSAVFGVYFLRKKQDA